ncbi:anthranilate synthase component I family protein [Streptomyces gilvosporeus]|uniref:2-amino-4-deoxychorismate synthase n=1 Tax=Streptomyces gilvosporeus TaxID=553510 RepID=A0A1V0TN29_9ACTN|nr:anthranilate synthase component I family protein [Streptomyces gilvosporeus]ARF54313.1 2-amino-4-deoxychorismate synthase [Streptomyces gilvosporeus]
MTPTTRGQDGTTARAGAPVRVRVTEAPLPWHDPLLLYTRLVAELGPQDVFLFESLAGPERDRGAAVVGCGRLAEVRVFARHIEVGGAPALCAALLAAAGEAGMTADPDAPQGAQDRLRFGDSAQVWDLMRRSQRLFDVTTARPQDSFAFGFLAGLGYEAAWHMDELPERTASSRSPDMTFTLFRHTVWYEPGADGARQVTARAEAFPADRVPDLAGHARAAADAAAEGDIPAPAAPAPRSVRDTVARGTFLDWARRCLEHIGIGDIYQIQIGHRIDVDTALTPVEVYRRLRSRNPSPYMYLAPRAGETLIGASPELFFRTEGDEIVMRPIAGTTRQGPTPEENARRVKEMLASTKEQAEHVMLIDLCRNDIGRVCRPRSLAVPDLMTVEAYSHVFHIVSTVTGRLEPRADVWQALCATFPAGTMTGAPKLRAMEIIDGIEREPRGSYAGALGLIDVRGWSSLALCIRTIVHDGLTYSTQSSAGIVAESVPEAEWDETLAKMGAAYWALTGEELL